MINNVTQKFTGFFLSYAQGSVIASQHNPHFLPFTALSQVQTYIICVKQENEDLHNLPHHSHILTA